jgi:hypothetical protein
VTLKKQVAADSLRKLDPLPVGDSGRVLSRRSRHPVQWGGRGAWPSNALGGALGRADLPIRGVVSSLAEANLYTAKAEPTGQSCYGGGGCVIGRGSRASASGVNLFLCLVMLPRFR